MQTDRDKWNRRFQQWAWRPPDCPAHLKGYWRYLNKGTVLDLASGDGAVALALAEGWHVTAVDIAEAALDRLAAFAREAGRTVTVLARDLDEPAALADLPLFDNIVVSRYKPSAALVAELVAHLTSGGILIISTFNQQHHRETGFSVRFCLAPGELLDLDSRLTLLRYDPGNALDTYVYRRDNGAQPVS